MKRAYYFSREELEEQTEIRIDLAEEVSFGTKLPSKNIENIEPNSKVIINATKTSYISDDILEMIEDFANVRAIEENINVSGFKTSYKEYETDQHSHIKITHKKSNLKNHRFKFKITIQNFTKITIKKKKMKAHTSETQSTITQKKSITILKRKPKICKTT